MPGQCAYFGGLLTSIPDRSTWQPRAAPVHAAGLHLHLVCARRARSDTGCSGFTALSKLERMLCSCCLSVGGAVLAC